jgi:hypothetical protein
MSEKTDDRSIEIRKLENNSPNRPKKCSIEEEGIITNDFFRKVAIKCRCGFYHPIMGGFKEGEKHWIKWIDPLNENDLNNLVKSGKSYSVLLAEIE